MNWTERREQDRAKARTTQVRREGAALRRLRGGVTVHELHDRLILSCVLAVGTPLDVTRRTLANLAEQGRAHERDGAWHPGSAPASVADIQDRPGTEARAEGQGSTPDLGPGALVLGAPSEQQPEDLPARSSAAPEVTTGAGVETPGLPSRDIGAGGPRDAGACDAGTPATTESRVRVPDGPPLPPAAPEAVVPAPTVEDLEALVLDVMGDEEAGQSNYHFFVNDNIPSAVYVLREGLTKEQQEQQMKIIGDGLKGGHNKHKSIVSSAVEDVKPIRQNHDDMAFKEQRKFTTERICAAMGVPRTILGYIEDVNHSNGESQYEKFIENTIRPWEVLLEEVFTKLLKDFDETAIFTINDEHIDDLEQRSKLAVQNVTNGLWTRNEARTYLGFDALNSNDLMDEIFVTTNQTPIIYAGEQPTPQGTPTDPNDPNAQVPPEEKPVKIKITHVSSHG